MFPGPSCARRVNLGQGFKPSRRHLNLGRSLRKQNPAQQRSNKSSSDNSSSSDKNTVLHDVPSPAKRPSDTAKQDPVTATDAPPEENPERLSIGIKLRIFAATITVISVGGYAAFQVAKYDVKNHPIVQYRNDGPKGKFDSATQKVRISDKPSKDREWSSYLPDWSPIKERIADVMVPQWANSLPGFVDKLQGELTAEPGTLAEEMWAEAHDPRIHPEITRDAMVRVSGDLCPEEYRFLDLRKHHTKKALAGYLDLSEDDIHPDDVPTIAMCGSGGGLRAMVAGASSYYSTQKAGLFDCVTYTAGVSGSCWLQSLYYSTITGQKLDRMLQHLKDRLGVHIAYPPDFLRLTTSAPTNKFLMAGGYEKYRGFEDADFGLVDVYGMMLGARLLVPKGDLAVDDSNLKLSSQTRYVDGGEHPLPVYTAVRHEIPGEEVINKAAAEVQEQAKKEAWFQWFEFTPYEFFCEELGAGIPTWAVGREFENGHNKPRDDGRSLPEIRVPLLMGIYASAFCATLSHYYKEIKPLVMGLTGFGGLDDMIESRNEDLVKVHPVDPAQVPNYAHGMKDRLPKSCPESINTALNIQLMDAGMSNNLPIYPLLRPGRDVDIIIAFDASADIKQENWLKVTDGYARQRGIKGWPIGTGWQRQEDDDPSETGEALDEADKGPESKAKRRIEQASQDQAHEKVVKETEEDAGLAKKNRAPTDLGFCNIWVGSTEERTSDEEPPRSKLVEEDKDLMAPNAGIAVVYFPFMPNPKVEGVDPQTSEYMSTWNFIYTPEQIDKVVELAKTNFDEGEEKTKMCIKAVYERKKAQRLERENQEKNSKKWWQVIIGK